MRRCRNDFGAEVDCRFHLSCRHVLGRFPWWNRTSRCAERWWTRGTGSFAKLKVYEATYLSTVTKQVAKLLLVDLDLHRYEPCRTTSLSFTR